MLKEKVIEKITSEFGEPSRVTAKVSAWEVNDNLGIVVEKDNPNRVDHAYVWLPYPPDFESVPEIALEYPAGTGRHSNTYASVGLEKGKPALKLIITNLQELEDVILYIHAFKAFNTLSELKSNKHIDPITKDNLIRVDVSSMPIPKPKKSRREAIPRTLQIDIWQRDGGQCVECGSKEKICFDHIVPFSKGGSNTFRNLQLLCESCNLSKGNRI